MKKLVFTIAAIATLGFAAPVYADPNCSNFVTADGGGCTSCAVADGGCYGCVMADGNSCSNCAAATAAAASLMPPRRSRRECISDGCIVADGSSRSQPRGRGLRQAADVPRLITVAMAVRSPSPISDQQCIARIEGTLRLSIANTASSAMPRLRTAKAS